MTDNKDKIMEEIVSNTELYERLKQLVLERVNVMPDTLRMAVGSDSLAKQDIVRHVQESDEIGRQVMEMELEFLRDLASGAVYANE